MEGLDLIGKVGVGGSEGGVGGKQLLKDSFVVGMVHAWVGQKTCKRDIFTSFYDVPFRNYLR